MARSLSWRESRALGIFVRRYPQLHLGIGLVGNGVFLLGTILFMFKKYEELGLWFFLVGTGGMFLGSLGEILRIKGKRRLWQADTDPVDPHAKWSETGRSSSALE